MSKPIILRDSPTRYIIAGNESTARNEFNLWNNGKRVVFVSQYYNITFFSEKEFLFSYAIAKFQHFVIFEE
jgi:hypothetical protein